MMNPRTWGCALSSVQIVHSVVADQRIRHGDDLSPIRGIGEHFLVTGHRSVETNLPDRRTGRAERFADKMTSIFECEDRAHVRREDARLAIPREKKLVKQRATLPACADSP
jgi:hypothetical protein